MQRLNTVARRYMIIIIIIAMSVYTTFWSLYVVMFQPPSNLNGYPNKVVKSSIVRFRAPTEENNAHFLKNSTKKSKPSNSTLGFDRIYVTDISNRPGRREKLEAIANKLNLDFSFFPAVSQFDHEALNELNLGDKLQPIQKAHYISHYKIYKSIVYHGYDNALILEGDIDMELNIKSIMADTHPNLPADWEILYLGHCGDLEGISGHPLFPSAYKLYKSAKPYCTHAYAVSSIGALKLLHKLSKPTMIPIDLELVNMVEKGILKSYTLIPPVFSRWHIYDNTLDVHPGKKTFDLFQLENSAYRSFGFNHESNSTFGFEHIYVINLLSRPDRREQMEKLANKLNLKLEFFEAVSKDDTKALEEVGGDLIPARKACYLSHYKVYQSIVQRGYSSALIFEDDVDFELNIASIIADTHRILPPDWEMIYLGYCGNSEGDEDRLLDGNNNSSSHKLFKSTSPVCNHSYGVSRAGALHLLEILSIHNNPEEPLDIELLNLIYNGFFISYSLVPPVVIQWRAPDNPSDIAPDVNVYDFYFLKNSALHVLLGLQESQYFPYSDD